MPEVVDAAFPETPIETPEVETPETPETEQPEPESPESTPEETPQTQGRIPSQFKEWIKNLQKEDPRAARAIQAAVYEGQKFRQAYPGGMKQIQEIAEISEAVGGREGLQAIEAERGEWEALDQQFSSGDPQFIESISSEDPEAFKKLVPHALTKFSQLAPEEYTHLMAGIVTETIRQPVYEAYQALASDEKTKQAAQKLADWYNNLDNQAKTKPVPKIDPERERFNKEREAFEQEKQQAYYKRIDNKMRDLNLPQYESAIAAQFAKAGRNLQAFKAKNPDSYRIMLEQCNTDLAAYLDRSEQEFMRQYTTYRESGDENRAIHFGQAKLKTLIPQSVAKTVRAFMSFGTGPRPAQANGTQAKPQPKPTTLQAMPNPKDIDWSRTTQDMVWQGKAYLKSQKGLVTFP